MVEVIPPKPTASPYKFCSFRSIEQNEFLTRRNTIVGYPPLHYSVMLLYVWSMTEESTVVADDEEYK